MTADIALIYSNSLGRADMAMAMGDIVLDAGLQTAITISLLSDRQAAPGDVLPDDNGPRGWWGDADNGFKLGSRLWLLRRAILTQTTLNLAQDYAREALQWLVDDGVAGSVSVVATTLSINIMQLAVTVVQAGNKQIYNIVWQGQAAGIA